MRRYSCVWMSIAGVVVVTEAYELFSANGYVLFGLSLALPCALLPAVLGIDATTPWYQRFWCAEAARVTQTLVFYLTTHNKYTTNTHIRTYAHTHTHTHQTHPLGRHTHEYTHTCAHTHIHTHGLAHTHARAQIVIIDVAAAGLGVLYRLG